MIDISLIKSQDPELAEALILELNRQQNNIELIASENFVSPAVLACAGSHLTNKYAEGYPAHRYYGGCQFVDLAEDLARNRLKELFGCEYCNVQPHSGASANLAVLFAVCNPGDTVMGMNLSHGGHLSHGSPVNISGKYFNIVSYGVSEDGEVIDYDEMEKIALECKPKIIICGASAYPRIIDFKRIREICDKAGALMMADIAHIAGLVVAGLHPSPVPYADFVTTTTHKTLRGPRGGVIMCKEQWGKAIDKAIFPGIQGGPLMHIISAKAMAFKEALSPDFKEYQKQIVKNASAMAETFKEHNIKMVSGGTDNHLILLNLSDKGITGKELEKMLDEVHITVNKNAVPFDKEKPFVTSGIRIGTPAMTTRGMKEPEAKKVAALICEVIEKREKSFDNVKSEVAKLCSAFPLYKDCVR